MTSASRPSSIKPPMYHLPVPVPLPELPAITTDEAVRTLLRTNIEDRFIKNATIEDLRPIIGSFLEKCPDPTEYRSIIFRNVVIRYADLRDFVIPHELHFAFAFFLNELDLGNSTLNSLNISGYYVKGNLGLVNLKKCQEVSIQNCQIDGVHCFASEINRIHLFGVRIADSITIADAEKIKEITCESNCDFYRGIWFQNLSPRNISFNNIEVGEFIHFNLVNVENSILIHDSEIKADIKFETSSCNEFSLSASSIHGQCDVRGLDFDILDVSNLKVRGRFLLSPSQLISKEKSWRSLLPKTDRPSKVEKKVDRNDISVQDQLYTLKEIFHANPAYHKEEDYCLYRIMELHRKRGNIFNTFMLLIRKFCFGYMLSPLRIGLSGAVVILIFAAAMVLWPFGDIQTLAGISVKDSIGQIFYFSATNFVRVGSDGFVVSGPYMKILALTEAVLGVLYIPFLTIVLARKLLRW